MTDQTTTIRTRLAIIPLGVIAFWAQWTAIGWLVNALLATLEIGGYRIPNPALAALIITALSATATIWKIVRWVLTGRTKRPE